MARDVQILFRIPDEAAIQQTFRNIQATMDRMKDTAAKAGVSIDVLAASMLKVNSSRITQATRDLEKQATAATAAAAAQERYNRTMSEGRARFDRQGSSVTNLGSASPADRVVARKFDEAAKSLNATGEARAGALGKVAEGAEKVAQGTGGAARGLNIIENQLLRIGGLPAPRVFGSILRLGVGGGPIALAIAGITALVGGTIAAMEKIRQSAEAEMQRIQALASFGLHGPLSTRKEEIGQLTKTEQEFKEEAALTGTASLYRRRDVKETGITGFLRQLAGSSRQTTEAQEIINRNLPDELKPKHDALDALRDLLNKTTLGRLTLLTPIGALGPGLKLFHPEKPEAFSGDRGEVERRRLEALQQQNIIESQVADPSSIYGYTFQFQQQHNLVNEEENRVRASLGGFGSGNARDVNYRRYLTQQGELTDKYNQTLAGLGDNASLEEKADAFRMLQVRLKALGDELIRTANNSKIMDERFKDNKAAENFIRQNFDPIAAQIKQVATAGKTNPYVAIYDDADARLRKFSESAGLLNQKIIDSFKEMNEKIRETELFKATLTTGFQISGLISQREDLLNPDNANAFSNARGSRLLKAAQYEEQARQVGQGGEDAGDLARRQVRIATETAGLSTKDLAQAIIEATAHLNPAQLAGAGLEGTRRQAFLDLASEQRKERTPAAVTEAQRDVELVKRLTSQLGLKPGDERFNFANQQLLQVLDRLTPEQKTPELQEAQLRAINAQIEIEQKAQDEARAQRDTTNSLLAHIYEALSQQRGKTAKEIEEVLQRAVPDPSRLLDRVEERNVNRLLGQGTIAGPDTTPLPISGTNTLDSYGPTLSNNY